VIVTDRFVFLHLHKSGGTFVNAFLARFFPAARFVGYHLPRSHVPEAARGLPIFGVVRNPWDYYVSWHSFQESKAQPNALYRIVSDDRRLDFRGTVANLVSLCDDPLRHAALVTALPENFPNRGINLTRSSVASLPGSGLGFYSFQFQRMFGDGAGVTFGRMESLRADLLAFLPASGVTMTEEMRAWITDSPPVNTSVHDSYRRYYDEPLRDLVAARDSLVIQKFGYTFAP
jgi:hypothetical protein